MLVVVFVSSTGAFPSAVPQIFHGSLSFWLSVVVFVSFTAVVFVSLVMVVSSTGAFPSAVPHISNVVADTLPRVNEKITIKLKSNRVTLGIISLL